jgi:hypothetical protein
MYLWAAQYAHEAHEDVRARMLLRRSIDVLKAPTVSLATTGTLPSPDYDGLVRQQRAAESGTWTFIY